MYRHVRAAAHHAMSAKLCRCGINRCLHRYLLHTVFMEKVLESYSRHGGSRDAETQTPRDDDDCTTGCLAASGRQTGQGVGLAAGSGGNAGGRGDDGEPATARKPCGCRNWKLFHWLRPKEVNAAAKPKEVIVDQPSTSSSSLEVVPPTQQQQQQYPLCTDRGDGEKKVKRRAGRGWNPFRWLCLETAADPTASSVKIRSAQSRTKPMELRLTRKKNTQKNTVTKKLQMSSSTSAFLHVCPL